MRWESRAQRGNPWEDKLDIAAGIRCDRTGTGHSILFLFGRETSGIRPFEELCVAFVSLDDARVKVCSGLGWSRRH